jgi:cell division protein FtsQ
VLKKRLIQALWITAGIGTVVLLGAAMQKKNHKVCTEVKIEITGAEEHMFIDEKDVLNILNASGEIVGKDIASITLRQMEEELETNAWVKNAELFFDNQQVLMVSIEERQPTARIFTSQGSSFYLDTAGVRLPLSEKVSARVPVFTNFSSDKKVMSVGDSLLLKDVIKLGTFIMADSFWMAQIAQVDVQPNATFEIIPVIGDHVVAIGNADNLQNKFNRLYTFYKEAWMQNGINKYEKLDVQFANQIVAIKKGMSKLKADTAKATALANGLAVVPTTDSLLVSKPASEEKKKDTAGRRTPKPVIDKSVKKPNNKTPVRTAPKPVIGKPAQPKPTNNKPRAVMNNGH